MTEDEARKKWCPFARRLFDWNEEISYNRCKDDSSGSLCIASDCMAWRWAETAIETAEFYMMGLKPEGDGWKCTLSEDAREEFSIKSRWERPRLNRRGFCGLAGAPQ